MSSSIPTGLVRDDWLDLLITHRLQPAFDADRLLVVHDYPASQCALARIRHGDPPVAERFEVYLGPLELANGYHELRDADRATRAFRARPGRARGARHSRRRRIDEALLAALGAGLPAVRGRRAGRGSPADGDAGHGPRSRDVLAFDFARA